MSETPSETTSGTPSETPFETLDAEGTGTADGDETLDVPLAALRPALEAVLMVADQPLDALTLATAAGHPVDDVNAALAALADEYTEQGRGFELRNVAGGWRFYSREEYAAVVEGFVLDGQQARLTNAALETLSVVAYKQPISRARVSAIRGVNVDGVMRTLLTRGLVEEAGSDHETGANLYRTTSYFLERIGVTSLDDLPELAPYLPDMDDMEDELERMAGGPGGSVADAVLPEPEPDPEPDPEPTPRTDPQPAPETAPEPAAASEHDPAEAPEPTAPAHPPADGATVEA